MGKTLAGKTLFAYADTCKKNRKVYTANRRKWVFYRLQKSGEAGLLGILQRKIHTKFDLHAMYLMKKSAFPE